MIRFVSKFIFKESVVIKNQMKISASNKNKNDRQNIRKYICVSVKERGKNSFIVYNLTMRKV